MMVPGLLVGNLPVSTGILLVLFFGAAAIAALFKWIGLGLAVLVAAIILAQLLQRALDWLVSKRPRRPA
jgi:Flp pilus assembly protein TadB